MVQGNLANGNWQLHTFDFGNRLREVAGIERYRYEAFGRRVSANDGSGQRLFSLYGSDGTLLHEHRRDRGDTHYIQLGKRLLSTRGNGVVTWQHNHAEGSPVVTTNGAGYTGHLMDAGTGLTYMQQRYMDPVLGVFWSVAPVAANSNQAGMFNRSRYTNGSPYSLSDLDGRKACGKDTECRPEQGERGGSVKSAGR